MANNGNNHFWDLDVYKKTGTIIETVSNIDLQSKPSLVLETQTATTIEKFFLPTKSSFNYEDLYFHPDPGSQFGGCGFCRPRTRTRTS